MSETTFNLDRENQVNANVDANGKQWKVHFNKQNGLCFVRPNPDREDAHIPKELKGLWTKPSIVQPLITKYVVGTWDKAEEADRQAERKRQVAREQSKAKNDTGSKGK